ncbi:hypothetical protein GO988_05030 [Hymenobacter sp. HMF4947]|uniref:Uncharacterized protein n=1 Tax=Hymenobacter ginkgonis TaxID=2682976 RepID=A0A7K1TBA4_9BACT|nr:hypothetical protein [Hymenobacter ginkgonis]MVN75684.1 hypothetical protein [Hymenobacter ginkgonis]
MPAGVPLSYYQGIEKEQKHEKIEHRIFGGPDTTNALDGYASFRVGQLPAALDSEDGDLSIAMDHVDRIDVRPAVMTAARFKEWFSKA